MTDPTRVDAATTAAMAEQIEYAPGMRAEIRGEEWMIRGVERNTLGKTTLRCVGTSPLVRGREAIFIEELENNAGMRAALDAEADAGKLEAEQRAKFGERTIRVVDPRNTKLVADGSPMFMKARLFIESQWRRQIPTDEKLHVGQKAAMDLLQYQLQPASQALGQHRQRILIADAVGLGKTLEAGILLSELILRGKGKRILVVTVKSMMEQFQRELWNRFTIPLVRLDSQKIQSVRANLPTNYNPFNYYDKTIVSVDTLKEKEYQTHLENAYWDVIVVDEAQNVADRGKSKRNRLGELLAGRSDSMIMLSATPHDGRAKSFASLMNMLDPTAIADPENYGPDEIKGLFIRRSKKDVEKDLTETFPERRVTVEKVAASEAEERVWRIFADLRLESDRKFTNRGADLLFRTLLEKSLFSSHKACAKTIQTRLGNLESKLAKNQAPEQRAGLEKDRAALAELADALRGIDDADFSRFQRLVGLLKSKEYGWNPADPEDRIVIFTERIETMNYLADGLAGALGIPADRIARMSGADSDFDQQKLVASFGAKESGVRILVASDVASEGLNLHFCCHRLIHFDVPWSLMVFQQRNGRVDRYGQRRAPDIRYFLVDSRVEEIRGDVRVLEILEEKEKQAHENIGDALFFGATEQEETLRVGRAIESGETIDSFDALLAASGAGIPVSDDDDPDSDDFDDDDDDFDLDDLFGDASDAGVSVNDLCADDRTLMADDEFLRLALDALNESPLPAFEPIDKSSMRVRVTDALRRRLRKNLPDAAVPDGDWLVLLADKREALSRASKSLLDRSEPAAGAAHFLWQGHPLLDWVADGIALLFNRGEAPAIASPNLPKGDVLFLVAGTISNRRSAPVLDEWFAVKCRAGAAPETLEMDDAVRAAGLRGEISNHWRIDAGETDAEASLRRALVDAAAAMVGPAIDAALDRLGRRFREYDARTKAALAEELKRLRTLKERQYGVFQLSFLADDEMAPGQGSTFAERNKRKRMQERKVKIDRIFDSYNEWAKNTMTVENKPYLRIVAAVVGTGEGAQR